MLKKQTQPLIYVIVLLFLFILSACTAEKKPPQNICLSDQSECLVVKDPKLVIQFKTDVIVAEEPALFTIKTDQNIEKVYLRGQNMEMGTISIIITPVDNGYSGRLFLGLCSEPVMFWTLTVEFASGEQSNFEIKSYWKRPSESH